MAHLLSPECVRGDYNNKRFGLQYGNSLEMSELFEEQI